YFCLFVILRISLRKSRLSLDTYLYTRIIIQSYSNKRGMMMTRPSRNTDQLLIEAGRRLVNKTGISGLKVREVAAKAKVNLGMFHYHFKNNEEFGRRILSAIYEDFFKQFTLQTGKEGEPLDRLKRALFALAAFGRGNRELLLALIQDVMKGHKGTIKFLKENMLRHASIIVQLIRECQDKGI